MINQLTLFFYFKPDGNCFIGDLFKNIGKFIIVDATKNCLFILSGSTTI